MLMVNPACYKTPAGITWKTRWHLNWCTLRNRFRLFLAGIRHSYCEKARPRCKLASRFEHMANIIQLSPPLATLSLTWNWHGEVNTNFSLHVLLNCFRQQHKSLILNLSSTPLIAFLSRSLLFYIVGILHNGISLCQNANVANVQIQLISW